MADVLASLTRTLAESMKDPALTIRWIANIPGMGVPPEFVIEQLNVPFMNTPPNPRFYGGQMWEFPGVASYAHCNLVVYENDAFHVTKLISNWRHSIYDPVTLEYGLPVNYKKNIEIKLFDNTHQDHQIRIRLERCWLTGQQDYDLNYVQSDGRLTVNIPLTVTRTLIYQ